jgi:DNA adenine methylase
MRIATQRSRNPMSMPILKAPFPWFGGKSRVAPLVWERFGNVPNYVELFFGSGAVLLGRPHDPGIETVNDKDCYLANFWRAIAHDPESVAHYADWPVNEADLHARHLWLVKQADFRERMMTDPDYYDSKIAGWWVWGLSQWIGGGWCQVRQGPHHSDDGVEVSRRRPHISDSGMGVHRQRPHVGNSGMGVHHNGRDSLLDWFPALAERLRRVRVCCGDWSRIVGPSPTVKNGLTGVFLDPPYAVSAGRDADLYSVDDGSVSREVAKWAIENGDNPLLRIALCGYEGEHQMPDTWECVHWKTQGGYACQGNGNGRENSARERIWFSPHCLRASLF